MMKTIFRKTALLGLFGVMFVLAQTAHAFYDPSLGRWINRDPLGDDGALVYAITKLEPHVGSNSQENIVSKMRAMADPLSAFARVNLNLFTALGNSPVNNIDPLGLDFADCYADCLEKNRAPVSRCIAHIANAAGNKIAGGTGRVGVGGTPPHPTTWQHKVGSKLGSVGSKVGKAAGRAAVVLTIADGFHDLGLLGGCAAACAGE